MIDITLLGTSALMPLPERALTAAVLSCGGRSLLLDCGEGTQIAVRRAGVSLMKADAFALTHMHGDHIFGIPGLLQTLGIQGRTEPLRLICPAGQEPTVALLLRLAEPLPFPVSAMALPPEGIALSALHPGWPDGARLTAFPTRHRVPSQGYAFTLDRAGRFLADQARALGVPVPLWRALQRGQRVEFDGRVIEPSEVLGPARRGLKVVFSGDTTACPELEDAARDADLLISEATYGEAEQAEMATEHGHMCFTQAAALAARAHVKRLWLAHFSQRVEDPALYLPLAQALFPAAVCGEDGMSMKLGFDGE